MLNYSIKKKSVKTDILAITVYSNSTFKLSSDLQEFQKQLNTVTKAGEFQGKAKSSVLLYGSGKIKRLLVLGLGEKKALTTETIRELGGIIAQSAKKTLAGIIDIHINDLPKHIDENTMAHCISEAFIMALYEYKQLKTDEEDSYQPQLLNFIHPNNRIDQAIKDAFLIGQNVNLARDLCNSPGNKLTPGNLETMSIEMAKNAGLLVKVMNEEEMQSENMNALLSVSKGSDEEAKFIILEHKPNEIKSDDTIVFIGKGVTFDSGGISLKPPQNMHEMKADMSGAAAVFSALKTAAELKLPIHVIGLMPCSENLPNGRANKPGDVVKSRNGKTIEIQNTDAEGRLLLADALSFAEQYDPDVVIDLATLTGAMVISLGAHVTGMMGNNEVLMDEIFEAGEETYERVWQLPLYDEYNTQIKSDVADLVNTGGKPAGSITAALFLSKFAENFNWAHLDIAGTATSSGNRSYSPKGSSGVAVRLLTQFLKNRLK